MMGTFSVVFILVFSIVHPVHQAALQEELPKDKQFASIPPLKEFDSFAATSKLSILSQFLESENIDCFPTMKPSKEMVHTLKGAVAACSKEAIRSAVTFKRDLPCDALRNIIAGGMREGDADVMTYVQPRLPSGARVVDIADASTEEESREDDVTTKEVAKREAVTSQYRAVTVVPNWPGDDEDSATVSDAVDEDEGTRDDSGGFKSFEDVPEFAFIGDIFQTMQAGGPLQFSSVGVDPETTKRNPDGNLMTMEDEELQGKTGREFSTKRPRHPLNPVKHFMMHAIFIKLQEEMQECIVKELQLVDEDDKINPSLFKKFIRKAFQKDTDSDLLLLEKVIDECDSEVLNDTFGAVSFNTKCLEPRIKDICHSRLLSDIEVIVGAELSLNEKQLSSAKQSEGSNGSLRQSENSINKTVNEQENITESAGFLTTEFIPDMENS